MEAVKPDIGFKRELGRLSASQLNQCMQCGTCSAVCSLAPADRPFPRKEMIRAAWGMQDKLLGNVDVWLCHQCGDCSTSCPRDVKPASVIAAVRQKTYEHYMRPRFLARMVSRPALLPVAIAIPVVVIIVILSLAGTFNPLRMAVTFSIPDGAVDYSAFFPHVWLNSTFTALTFLFWGLALLGIARFRKDMKRITPPGETRHRPLFKVLGEILSHSNFSGCGSQQSRRWAHMLVFFGFALLILVTLYAIVASILELYPLSFWNPFKIAGNVASLMIYTGIGIMIWQRIRRKDVFGKSSYNDWFLLISVLLLTLSGTLVEAARFGNWAIAYPLYFFHLVVVWFVVMYLPFTKLGHVFYRTAALLYARSIGRK